jgi:hypothetical protein
VSLDEDQHDHQLEDDPANESVYAVEGETEMDRELRQAAALAMFDAKLKSLATQEKDILGRKNMWLAHHWPDDYAERCVNVGGRHVCRRCAALYPLGLLIAILSASGAYLWPVGFDPAAIWILSIPATVTYCGEAVGLFRYNPKVQVATTLIAALAFGRALGYEFVERWSLEFWGPITVFGGLWFVATMIGLTRKRLQPTEPAELA